MLSDPPTFPGELNGHLHTWAEWVRTAPPWLSVKFRRTIDDCFECKLIDRKTHETLACQGTSMDYAWAALVEIARARGQLDRWALDSRTSVTMADVLATCAQALGTTVDKLRNPKGDGEKTDRRVALVVIYAHGCTYADLGRFLGVHHTTVMYARDRAQEYAQEIAHVKHWIRTNGYARA